MRLGMTREDLGGANASHLGTMHSDSHNTAATDYRLEELMGRFSMYVLIISPNSKAMVRPNPLLFTLPAYLS